MYACVPFPTFEFLNIKGLQRYVYISTIADKVNNALMWAKSW